MTELLRKVSAHYVKPSFTEVHVGDTVRVFTRIQEGEKTRTQYFDGLVIRRAGGVGPQGSFTVRRIASGVGVERTFPLHSPVIERVEILRSAKVRRARLFTMRGLTGKAARLTEKPVDRKGRVVEEHPWHKEFDLKNEEEIEAVEEVATTEQLAEEAAEAEAVTKETDAPAATEGAPDAETEAEQTKVAKQAAKDANPSQKTVDNAESAPADAEVSDKKQAEASAKKADGATEDTAK